MPAHDSMMSDLLIDALALITASALTKPFLMLDYNHYSNLTQTDAADPTLILSSRWIPSERTSVSDLRSKWDETWSRNVPYVIMPRDNQSISHHPILPAL